MNFANPTTPKTILLTVDVEDWFQVENLRSHFPPTTWSHQELRVEKNTRKILDLLDSVTLKSTSAGSTKPRATFFVLGWIADRLPRLVREIQNRGHEVASHGYNHLMCQQLNEKDLKTDLGVKVKGYRAPNFSISDMTLNFVKESGYRYDSSYNNFSKHGRYGTISLNGRNIVNGVIKISPEFLELPISNLTIGKQIVPWGGGGYFRFFPLSLFKAGIRRILQNSGIYMFYLHPWELDPHQPVVRKAKGLLGWKHYLNLDKTHSRLHNLITTFSYCKFLTCSQFLDQIGKLDYT